jgi:Protein of unknown function (DUF2628)
MRLAILSPQPMKSKTLFFNPKRGLVAVKSGFSWPAFFFGSLWAAAKGMWLPYFAVMLVVDLVLWFVTGYAEGQQMETLALIGLLGIVTYAVVRGKRGNAWLAKSLIQRGYSEQPRNAA